MAGPKGERPGHDPREGARIPQSELRVVNVVEKEHRRGIPLLGLGSVETAIRLYAAWPLKDRADYRRGGSLESLDWILSDPRYTPANLTLFVGRGERAGEAAASGLNVLRGLVIAEDPLKSDFVDNRLVAKAMAKLSIGHSWDWSKNPPPGVEFGGRISVKPLEEQQDAYIFEAGYGDNDVEREFARSLGVERGVESSTIDVILAPDKPGRFRVDLEEVAARLQPFYAALDPYEAKYPEDKPYCVQPDGTRPALAGESMTQFLQNAPEYRGWVTLGVRNGVDVTLFLRDIGDHGQAREFDEDWTFDGTTASGHLGFDYDGHGGKEVRPPTLSFKIGRESSRIPAVNPLMIATIRDLSAQVAAAFPVNS